MQLRSKREAARVHDLWNDKRPTARADDTIAVRFFAHRLDRFRWSFQRATTLRRWIVRHYETASYNELRKRDLEMQRRALVDRDRRLVERWYNVANQILEDI